MEKIRSILFFAFFFWGCTKTKVNSNLVEKLQIKMIENIDSTKRTLTFNCYTVKQFECANYGIQSSFSVTNDKIIINFTEIVKPSSCLTALGPAYTILNLGTLSNKRYPLELNIDNVKISGQLEVATGSFKAKLPIQNKVQFINPDLKRVPQNTIYGTVHYHSSTTSSIVQKFIDTLQILGAVPTNYTPGAYEKFKIEANGQIRQTQNPGYYFTRHFIFNYSQNSIQIKDLVKRFGLNYPNLLLITLHTTKGETFYSWTP